MRKQWRLRYIFNVPLHFFSFTWEEENESWPFLKKGPWGVYYRERFQEKMSIQVILQLSQISDGLRPFPCTQQYVCRELHLESGWKAGGEIPISGARRCCFRMGLRAFQLPSHVWMLDVGVFEHFLKSHWVSVTPRHFWKWDLSHEVVLEIISVLSSIP